MMPLTEIDRLKQTVTEAWTSPIADEVAAAWGYEPGTARWWRSSASHVFVLPDPRGKRYLRFAPEQDAGAEAVAALMERLAENGTPVVRPVRADSGRLTVTVPTAHGPMRAMVVEAAAGEEADADELTADRARAWGRALAIVHRDAADVDAVLPQAFGELAEAAERFPGDAELAEAVARLGERVAALPRDNARFGVVHGDFELDNLAWEGDRATAFDFDEAAHSWYAADVAFALRDLTGPDGAVAEERRALVEAFIAGYRGVRGFTEAEVASLRLFTGVHAVCSLVRITRALGTPDAGEPEWLAGLRSDLEAMAREQRALALAVAGRAVLGN
ncbi:phosphotransferase enzyme family protein [Glycomyces tritici]|uniref:Phosphotransferase n=1 Tax=Glycomyces tritici TaxID=2665176 RepID=A0ABT7YSR8_9ACTN|nr:phosphotransferase [Glycomyces tritici]MDN3241693.1 phosphotransferase [Glycomyces tritici]